MKIGIFGDSQVDPHHVRMCSEVNPLINYNEAIKQVWYNRLSEKYDVEVHAQVSRDNFWIDEKWREHHSKYDLCIIRPAPGPRIRFNIPDEEWHSVHKKVFGNFGPGTGTLQFTNTNFEHSYIKTIHFWSKYILVQDDYKRVYELLCKEWMRDGNTIVFPMNTISNIGGSQKLFEIKNRPEKAKRAWNAYMQKKYPGIDLNLMDQEITMLPFHRNPNHIAIENHKLIFELLEEYITTGSFNIPVQVESNPTWDFPHPIMDILEENAVENNKRAGNIK